MQKEHWDPLLIWLSETFNVEVTLASGFLPAQQDASVIERLRKELEQLDPWELAGRSKSNQAKLLQRLRAL